MSDAAVHPGSAAPAYRAPHPVVWTILYLPFGALGGFVTVALTFLATRNGLSITEGSLLNGAQMLTSWLKWLWAPLVDITLTPRRWYLIATGASAAGVVAMSAIPLSPATLGLLLAVIAAASLINSMVGMSIEAIMAATTTKEEQGRVSSWFQAGNLGGSGLGGGLGLLLLEVLPEPWMAGAILGVLFLCCCLALLALPPVHIPRHGGGVTSAIKGVIHDLFGMVKTKGGLLSAFLCVLPVGTGAAQGTLTQASVAAHWGAGAQDVGLLQGLLAGVIQIIGCFGGGWLCTRFHPRTAYAVIGVILAVVATGMALTPPTLVLYYVWNITYSFGVGLAYAAFTAVVLNAMGPGSAATKYNLMASLSNFPIWWLGLLLGRVADVSGPSAMLLTEAALCVLGVGLFAAATRVVGGTKLAD